MRVCADDSDISFKSCDRVVFKVHLRNLRSASEVLGLPDDGILSTDEIVQLDEKAKVLELLFEFMYPRPQPDLQTLKFKTAAALAEAAEKYQVFPALSVCRIYMG